MVQDWEGNTVVYTAVTTDFEHLGDHKFTDGVDYIYFTDGCSKPTQSRWEVVHLPDLGHLHPRRAAKIPKVNPHFFKVLTRYKYAIWIDGDMQIMQERFPEEILSFLRNGMVISPHFDGRDCGYGEAGIRPPKYKNEPVDQQVEFYRKDEFPEHQGLYEGGVIARDMTNDSVRELGQMWLIQNMVWSYQDQVSLPYCFWKMGFKPDVLPTSFRNFDWLHINAHKRED